MLQVMILIFIVAGKYTTNYKTECSSQHVENTFLCMRLNLRGPTPQTTGMDDRYGDEKGDNKMIPPELYLDTISIGFWFTVAGYHFLMFGFFFFQRYRTRRTMYWLYLALFFLLLAFGRGFFILYDFYSENFLWWRVGTSVQWFSLGFLALLIGYLILDDPYHRIFIAIPPPIIAIMTLVIPDAMISPIAAFRIIVNNVLAPIYALVLPALFFYLAYNSVGTIRRGSVLNGIGFLVLYAGRVMAAELIKQALAPWVSAILAPGLVILALILISYGNQYELLK